LLLPPERHHPSLGLQNLDIAINICKSNTFGPNEMEPNAANGCTVTTHHNAV
jgi:hypothetical protein